MRRRARTPRDTDQREAVEGVLRSLGALIVGHGHIATGVRRDNNAIPALLPMIPVKIWRSLMQVKASAGLEAK